MVYAVKCAYHFKLCSPTTLPSASSCPRGEVIFANRWCSDKRLHLQVLEVFCNVTEEVFHRLCMLKDFEVVLSHVLEPPNGPGGAPSAGLGPTYLPRLLDHYQEPAGATRQLSYHRRGLKTLALTSLPKRPPSAWW